MLRCRFDDAPLSRRCCNNRQYSVAELPLEISDVTWGTRPHEGIVAKARVNGVGLTAPTRAGFLKYYANACVHAHPHIYARVTMSNMSILMTNLSLRCERMHTRNKVW